MYKYELRKGSKKETCPSCGHAKCFVPYVLSADGQTLAGAEFGRCERINSCGYIKYPSDNTDANIITRKQIITTVNIVPDYVPWTVVKSTFKNFNKNPFLHYIADMYSTNIAIELQQRYNIGTANNGGTIFWQIDNAGKCRTGKVLYYDATTGKRSHTKNAWYIHKKIKRDFCLQQVFFGEHLAREDYPIALCESEKTAVLMSVEQPQYTWLAAGGSEMLSNCRLARLPRLDSVYADNMQREKWSNKTAFFKNRIVNLEVDVAVSRGLLQPGDDIWDLIEFKKKLKTNEYI